MPRINPSDLADARVGGGVLIDEGTYEAELIAVKRQGFSKNGPDDNAYNFTWKLTPNNARFANARVYENILLDPEFASGKSNFKFAILVALLQDAELIEVDEEGNFEWPEDELDIAGAGIVKGIRVTHNEYNDKVTAQVSGYVSDNVLEKALKAQTTKDEPKVDKGKGGLFV